MRKPIWALLLLALSCSGCGGPRTWEEWDQENALRHFPFGPAGVLGTPEQDAAALAEEKANWEEEQRQKEKGKRAK